MTTIVSLEEKLQSEAEFGLFFAHQKITQTKAKNLRDEGLSVTDLHITRSSPRLHYISWKEAKVDCLDVHSLDETSNQYTLAQKLWIISMKNKLVQ